MGRVVVAAYRPKPGFEKQLEALVRDHVPTLRRLGLATDRKSIAMRALDGTVLEVFEWESKAAIDQAHHDPEVQVMWSRFGAACDYVSLEGIAETKQLFAEFEPIEF